jgi:hypothetical protein
MPDHPADWRRAIEVLANSSETITGLVDTGLATATIEPFLADGRTVEVMRFRISDRGRTALGG